MDRDLLDVLAILASGAKARDVERTGNSANVFVRTSRSCERSMNDISHVACVAGWKRGGGRGKGNLTRNAEALGEGSALWPSLSGPVVEVHALFARLAVAVGGVEPALWHFAHVELVQELTLGAFLAEAAQPVLAHGARVGGHGHRRGRSEVSGAGLGVSVGAVDAAGALVGQEVSADLGVGVQLEVHSVLDVALDVELHVVEGGLNVERALLAYGVGAFRFRDERLQRGIRWKRHGRRRCSRLHGVRETDEVSSQVGGGWGGAERGWKCVVVRKQLSLVQYDLT